MTHLTSGQPPQMPAQIPASQKVMFRALKWGAIITVVLAVAAGTIGYLVTGQPGLIAGVLGALFSGLFVALTAASIAIANLFYDRDFYLGAFFGIVMGSWLLKFVIFLIAAFVLRDQTWLEPRTMFITVIVGVVLSLGIDVWIMATSRIPTVSELVFEQQHTQAKSTPSAQTPDEISS